MTWMRRLLAGVLCASVLACVPRGDPALGGPFRDDFERAELGPLWRNTGGAYQIVDGKLRVRGARNKPLWLKRTLPRNARIEFDVRSESPEGDIKVEIYGDGVSKATEASYTATSYVVIFGGWNNSKNVLARMNEHGSDRVEGPSRPVEKGRTYHMKIERQGDTITAWVDDQMLVKMNDPDPLWGVGHDHFGINNWQSELWFDNLVITPI
ncbi:MAG: DUF1080 domain-containing protein [Myxococcales bacterium]